MRCSPRRRRTATPACRKRRTIRSPPTRAVPAVPPSVNPPALARWIRRLRCGADTVAVAISSPLGSRVARRGIGRTLAPNRQSSPATSPVRVASAPSSSNSEGFFSSLARKIGIWRIGHHRQHLQRAGQAGFAPVPKTKPAVAAADQAAAPGEVERAQGRRRKPEPKERDTAMAGAQPSRAVELLRQPLVAALESPVTSRARREAPERRQIVITPGIRSRIVGAITLTPV